MSLCALIYSKITKITSVDDMTQIMIVGIHLYSCLSLLARQSLSMSTELPGVVTVFEQFFHLEYSDNNTCNIHHYCICHSQVRAFETLLALNYDSLSSELRLGDIMYLILMLEICIITVIVKGHVYCWKYHQCIN